MIFSRHVETYWVEVRDVRATSYLKTEKEKFRSLFKLRNRSRTFGLFGLLNKSSDEIFDNHECTLRTHTENYENISLRQFRVDS